MRLSRAKASTAGFLIAAILLLGGCTAADHRPSGPTSTTPVHDASSSTDTRGYQQNVSGLIPPEETREFPFPVEDATLSVRVVVALDRAQDNVADQRRAKVVLTNSTGAVKATGELIGGAKVTLGGPPIPGTWRVYLNTTEIAPDVVNPPQAWTVDITVTPKKGYRDE